MGTIMKRQERQRRGSRSLPSLPLRRCCGFEYTTYIVCSHRAERTMTKVEAIIAGKVYIARLTGWDSAERRRSGG